MKIIKNKIPLLTIFFTAIILLWVSSNKYWGKDRWKNILESDAKGYYSYLPAIFIYHDLNYGFFDKIEKEKYFNKFLFYDYRTVVNNKYTNKYFAGTALCEMPFFLIAHMYAHISGSDTDGFSKPYLISVNIAVIFYLLLGLYFLNKTLRLYNITDKNIALVLFSIVFGTNIYYYTIGESGMSHVYSFSIISIFIYLVKDFFENKNNKFIILIGLFLGIITLIRPINLVILLALPFIAGSIQNLKEGFGQLSKNYFKTSISIIFFVTIASIQPIIYKISTGNFITYTYGNEYFDFLNPHFIDILFSYKKGLFIYTPLLFLSILGLIKLYRNHKFESITFFLFFIIITYIFSSWCIWWYGGSFSSRVYIDYFALFGIVLALFLNQIKNNKAYRSLITLIFLLVIICQIQTYQYRYFVIHYENMTKELYWSNFLRIDRLL